MDMRDVAMKNKLLSSRAKWLLKIVRNKVGNIILVVSLLIIMSY